MTINKDDKVLTEDQAFIQSIYDDISHHHEDEFKQPSEQLDQRILAEAHKAVGAKPMLCNDETSIQLPANEEPKLSQVAKRRKKIAWYYPLATVASVLLVAILVKHEQYSPMNPLYEIDSIAMMEPIVHTKQSKSSAPPAERSLQVSSDQMMHSLTTQQAYKKEQRVSKSDIAFAEREIENKMLQLASAKDSFSSTQSTMKSKVYSKSETISTPSSARSLSHERYEILHAQSMQKTLYWRLKHENGRSYLIELFKTESSSLFYRLDKKSFQLSKSDKNRKYSFKEIIYIADEK